MARVPTRHDRVSMRPSVPKAGRIFAYHPSCIRGFLRTAIEKETVHLGTSHRPTLFAGVVAAMLLSVSAIGAAAQSDRSEHL